MEEYTESRRVDRDSREEDTMQVHAENNIQQGGAAGVEQGRECVETVAGDKNTR